MKVYIALAGNPNVGKSVIFNALTGMRQHIGNWPGKTVERKEGYFTYEEVRVHVIDLPGTYSLTPYSMEELIARDYIIEERPDLVVNVIDASNLERNLYLTVQLLELEAPLLIALNKMDLAEEMGYRIDVEVLKKLLGVPIVAIVATKGIGLRELKRKVVEVVKCQPPLLMGRK